MNLNQIMVIDISATIMRLFFLLFPYILDNEINSIVSLIDISDSEKLKELDLDIFDFGE